MGTRERPGDYDCHERAEPNEPRFTLIGRDPTAGALVRLWVRLRIWLDPASVESERAKYEEALRCADAMDQWAAQISKRKRDQVSAVTNELTVTLGIGNAGRLRAQVETQEVDEGNGVTTVIESPQGDRVRIRKGETKPVDRFITTHVGNEVVMTTVKDPSRVTEAEVAEHQRCINEVARLQILGSSSTIERVSVNGIDSRTGLPIENGFVSTPRVDAAIAMLEEIVRVFRNEDGTIAETATAREIVEYCEQRAEALRRERDHVKRVELREFRDAGSSKPVVVEHPIDAEPSEASKLRRLLRRVTMGDDFDVAELNAALAIEDDPT
jgi:hypothetical protein